MTVENKQEYLTRLKLAVEHLHGTGSTWLKTVTIHELFRGQTVWHGNVEVFELENHPKSKRCYAWSHKDGENDQDERFVAVLEIPPVESAKTAVQASIVADGKNQQS